jgi:hypothetical protein
MSVNTVVTGKQREKERGYDDRMYTSLEYFKSPEGLAEYEKLGIEYPRVMQDEFYEKFLRITRATKQQDRKFYIRSMVRHILANGEQYIIHDIQDTAYDGLHNRKTFYRGGMGKYAKPVPHREIKARITEDEGMVQDIITTVDTIETGYSISFNQKNIDKLAKLVDGNTQYSIRKEDYKTGMTFSVEGHNAWRNGSMEELLRFGHIASEYEKQIMADEKQGKYTHMGVPPAGGAGLYK